MIAALLFAGSFAPASVPAATTADRAVAAAERRVATGAGPDAMVELASAFMRKARETGTPDYYDRAAAALDRALASDPGHDGAIRARAWVLMGQHEFAAALRAARSARARHHDDWWSYGNLADACMELGRYDDAARATERMERLRPGLSAHARVAALRAVVGDRRGAIAALEAALATADAADAEERAWLFTYLGHEHWALGELAAARVAYEAALRAFPDYHLALPALARVRAASGDAAGASELYERALTLAPTPSVAGALGDLYAAGADPARARATYDFAMYMGRVATARGRTLGRELATFLVDHDRDLAEAQGLAAAEAVRRHDVYTEDALAWALAANGRLADAKRAMSRALRLGTEEAAFDFHAGMIAVRLGQTRTGARRLRRALALNPYFDAGQARIARTTLTGLEG